LDTFWDMLGIIAALAAVFWLTWVATRFIAKKSGGRMAGRFMRVVDRLGVGNDKALLLVKIGATYSVIGVAGHEMRLIRTLDPSEAEEFEAAQEEEKSARRPGGAENGVWGGVQTFGERLGFAMKNRARPKAQPYSYEEEYSRDEAPQKPQDNPENDRSAIDMMNERIRLRKESKWK
jgi:flagellar protein FliO/FliZ